MFILKRNDVSPAVSRLVKLAKRPEPVLRAMGTTFKSITEGCFNSAGAQYRPIPWVPKRDGTASNLQRSTTLAKSFQLEVSNTQAVVSNPMIYARIHQLGGTIVPKAKKFLSWIGAGGQRFFAKKVVIPPRPFFPVLDGRLTPAAERLVLRAGERVIAKQG